MLSLQRGLDFRDSEGREIDQKTIKNRSKNEVNMGWYLGIDFSSILVDLGSQVGRQNRTKIDQKWHRKNDEKMKRTKNAKKSEKVLAAPCGTRGPRPRGGSPPLGLDKPRPLHADWPEFPPSLFCSVLSSLAFSSLFRVLSWLFLSFKSHSWNAWKAFWYCKNSTFMALSYCKIRWENHETF